MRHHWWLDHSWLAAIMILGVGAASADDASCRAAIGAERAARLVRQCRDVSPATHPPCNAANPCDMIVGEITRGCRMIDEDRIAHPEWQKTSPAREPSWCAGYLRKSN
ncbi:MAG TPA: hypothetical protein VGP42_00445 [Stellaceae bacterium]|jgi:hypothetical protein|nr:hypothetical protein [Stellaceae bacterium]